MILLVKLLTNHIKIICNCIEIKNKNEILKRTHVNLFRTTYRNKNTVNTNVYVIIKIYVKILKCKTNFGLCSSRYCV